jgi:hypothetical protein
MTFLSNRPISIIKPERCIKIAICDWPDGYPVDWNS